MIVCWGKLRNIKKSSNFHQKNKQNAILRVLSMNSKQVKSSWNNVNLIFFSTDPSLLSCALVETPPPQRPEMATISHHQPKGNSKATLWGSKPSEPSVLMGAWRPVMYRSGNDSMSIEWYIVYIYLMMPYLFENVFFHMNVIFRGGISGFWYRKIRWIERNSIKNTPQLFKRFW